MMDSRIVRRIRITISRASGMDEEQMDDSFDELCRAYRSKRGSLPESTLARLIGLWMIYEGVHIEL